MLLMRAVCNATICRVRCQCMLRVTAPAITEHEYTDANLSFEHLKGTDRGMARALATCPGFDAHLVLVTRTVSGGAEWSGGCGYRRRRWYEDSESEEDEGGHHEMTDVSVELRGFLVVAGLLAVLVHSRDDTYRGQEVRLFGFVSHSCFGEWAARPQQDSAVGFLTAGGRFAVRPQHNGTAT